MSLSICRVSNSRQCWVIVSFLCDEAVFRLSLLLLCVTSATRCHSGSLSVSRCYWGQKTSSPSVLAGDPAKLHTFTRLVFWGFVEQLQTFRLDFTAACKKKSVWRWDVWYWASERTSSAAGRLDQEQRRSRKDQRFVDEMRMSREIWGRGKSLS